MPTCNCGRTFSDPSALGQHQRAKQHCFCKHCDRTFSTPEGLQRHTLDLHNWRCGHCNARFSGQEKVTQHQRSTGHCYCRDCKRFFVHDDALQQHLHSTLHASQFRCCDCDRDFVNEHALDQHLANKTHNIRRYNSETLCKECDREFSNEQALQQHRASVVHHPLSNVKCIVGGSGRRGCRRRFSCPSALLHHLESGVCQSSMTRKKLNAMVQMNDVDHVISSPDSSVTSILLETASRQLRLGSSGTDTPTTFSDGSVIFTPNSSTTMGGSLSPRINTPLSDQSDALALFSLVSSSRTCPLCPTTRRPFPSPEALQQHLYSPAHSRRMFHCPLSLLPASSNVFAVRKSFSTLSGLAQHLESGACEGGNSMFRKAAEYIEGRLSEMGIRKVNLLL